MRRAPKNPERRPPSKFDFRLSNRAQLALLHLPELRNQLARERRLFLVMLFARLSGKISQNAFAAVAGVPASAICQWRKTYEQYGADGLLNRPHGRKPLRRLPPPCVLMFGVKT
jgi:hypothetical protein